MNLNPSDAEKLTKDLRVAAKLLKQSGMYGLAGTCRAAATFVDDVAKAFVEGQKQQSGTMPAAPQPPPTE